MASRIKLENAEKLLSAASNTINDLLKEKWELEQQIKILMQSKNEKTIDRRSMDRAS